MIDQFLYEKYSGRRGNPEHRWGKAIAALTEQEQRDHAAHDRSLFARFIVTRLICLLMVLAIIVGGLLALWGWHRLSG